MTNERIVELIRQGRDDLYVTLWEQVKNFIAAQAYKRIRRSQGFDKGGTVGSVDAEDLVQSGYIALTRAVETYTPGKASFISWLDLNLKTAFSEAQGLRTSKRDPLDECISLDRPRAEEGEETIGDRIKADDCFRSTIEEIYNDELRAALDKALSEIPARQAEVLRKTDYEGKTLKKCGAEIGVSCQRVRCIRRDALASMRANNGLRAFLDDEIDYYLHVGEKRFNTTHQSSTELLAFRRMDLEEKYKELFM